VHELAKIVGRIIQVEGPIHREEIARRVTQLSGLQRTGKRIRSAVEKALGVVSRCSTTSRDGDFYLPAGQGKVAVRDRSSVDCATLRQPKMLPPVEIRIALTAIVEVHLGVPRDEAVTEAARLLGFKATSAQLRQVIEAEADWLVSRQILDQRNGKLYLKKTA
jgi:hypothetical protein